MSRLAAWRAVSWLRGFRAAVYKPALPQKHEKQDQSTRGGDVNADRLEVSEKKLSTEQQKQNLIADRTSDAEEAEKAARTG